MRSKPRSRFRRRARARISVGVSAGVSSMKMLALPNCVMAESMRGQSCSSKRPDQIALQAAGACTNFGGRKRRGFIDEDVGAAQLRHGRIDARPILLLQASR